MKKISLDNFTRGWLVGDFEPSLLKTKEIEVAIQTYNKGDEEPQHFHKKGTEISLMVSGSASFNDQVLNEGEGLIIYPNQSNIFKAVTDCKVLVIKYPSKPNDKFLGIPND